LPWVGLLDDIEICIIIVLASSFQNHGRHGIGGHGGEIGGGERLALTNSKMPREDRRS